jgi:hypothetical protein
MMIPRCCDYASVAPVSGAKQREHSTSRGVSSRKTGLQAADGALQRVEAARSASGVIRQDPGGPRACSTLKP